jgi:hypothetical protein
LLYRQLLSCQEDLHLAARSRTKETGANGTGLRIIGYLLHRNTVRDLLYPKKALDVEAWTGA